MRDEKVSKLYDLVSVKRENEGVMGGRGREIWSIRVRGGKLVRMTMLDAARTEDISKLAKFT